MSKVALSGIKVGFGGVWVNPPLIMFKKSKFVNKAPHRVKMIMYCSEQFLDRSPSKIKENRKK